MFTLLFLLLSLIPFGIASIVFNLASECNKYEALKPALIGLIVLCTGIYLDYKIILDTANTLT